MYKVAKNKKDLMSLTLKYVKHRNSYDKINTIT